MTMAFLQLLLTTPGSPHSFRPRAVRRTSRCASFRRPPLTRTTQSSSTPLTPSARPRSSSPRHAHTAPLALLRMQPSHRTSSSAHSCSVLPAAAPQLTRLSAPPFDRVQAFYENMHRALKPGGVVCAQGESAWLHLDLIKQCVGMCRKARGVPGDDGGWAPQRRAPSFLGPPSPTCRAACPPACATRRCSWVAASPTPSVRFRRTRPARLASSSAPKLAARQT